MDSTELTTHLPEEHEEERSETPPPPSTVADDQQEDDNLTLAPDVESLQKLDVAPDEEEHQPLDRLVGGFAGFLLRMEGFGHDSPSVGRSTAVAFLESLLGFGSIAAVFYFGRAILLSSPYLYPNLLLPLPTIVQRFLTVRVIARSERSRLFPPSMQPWLKKRTRVHYLFAALYPLIGVPVLIAVMQLRLAPPLLPTDPVFDYVCGALFFFLFFLAFLLSVPVQLQFSAHPEALTRRLKRLLDGLPVKAKIKVGGAHRRQKTDRSVAPTDIAFEFDKAIKLLAQLDEDVELVNSFISPASALQLSLWTLYIVSYMFIMAFTSIGAVSQLLTALMIAMLVIAIMQTMLAGISFNERLAQIPVRVNRARDSSWSLAQVTDFVVRSELVARTGGLTIGGAQLSYSLLWSYVAALANLAVVLAGLGLQSFTGS